MICNKKYIISLVVAFGTLLLVVGCTTREKKSFITDDDAIMSAIEEYISEHPDYNTYMMSDSKPDLPEVLSSKFSPGYVIGPCYYDLLKRHYCHHDPPANYYDYSFIDVGNCRVYIFGSKIGWGQEKGKDNWVNTHPTDTISADDDPRRQDPDASKDLWYNYYRRAIYFYKKDDAWHINHRPDTIFLPEVIVDFIVPDIEGI